MNEIWLMDEQYLSNYLDVVMNTTEEEIKAAVEQAGDISDLMKTPEILKIDGDTANIYVSGPLTKNAPSFFARLFGMGGTQYSQINSAIEQAESDPMVKKIDMYMDTPGGVAVGSDSSANAFKRATKPTRAINTGMMASAGYLIGSQADEILSSSALNLTGSIGVIISQVSQKNDNRKEITLRSSNAKNKNLPLDTPEGEKSYLARIDAMENVFLKYVSEGRGISVGKVKSDFGQGGVFIAQNPDGEDAIKVGMIDGIVEMESKPSTSDGSLYSAAAEKIEQESPVVKTDEIKTPQTRGKEFCTVKTLQELLSENPGAKVEYDKEIVAAEEKGEKTGTDNMQAKVDKIVPILASESYDSALKTQAKLALDGKMSIDTFQAMVGMEDMRLERKKGKDATDETGKLPETPAGSQAVAADLAKGKGVETKEDVAAYAEAASAVLNGNINVVEGEE